MALCLAPIPSLLTRQGQPGFPQLTPAPFHAAMHNLGLFCTNHPPSRAFQLLAQCQGDVIKAMSVPNRIHSGAVFRGAAPCHGVNHQRKPKLQQPLLARQVLLTTLFLFAEEASSFMGLLLGWGGDIYQIENCCCTCVVLMWLSLPRRLTHSSQRLV